MEQKGLDEKVRSVAGENGEAERSAIWWRSLLLHSMSQPGATQYKVVWYGPVRQSMVWYDML